MKARRTSDAATQCGGRRAHVRKGKKKSIDRSGPNVRNIARTARDDYARVEILSYIDSDVTEMSRRCHDRHSVCRGEAQSARYAEGIAEELILRIKTVTVVVVRSLINY